MNYVLIPLVIVLAALTVITLVRGIVAFLANTKADLARPDYRHCPHCPLLRTCSKDGWLALRWMVG